MRLVKFILALGFLFLLISLPFHKYGFISGRVGGGNGLKEAMYYRKLPDRNVQCILCPRECRLKDGQRGFCGARINRQGTLYSLSYGKTVAWTYPLFQRALLYCSTKKNMLRLATAGCNMKCKFCVSWEISQGAPEEMASLPYSGDLGAVTENAPVVGLLEPEDVIAMADKADCEIVVYNYGNEPAVNYEYVLETAKAAKAKGFINALATNGYVNEKALGELLKYMDGVTVGLKGFSEEVYGKYCSATLEPVKRSLKIIKDYGTGLEITYVIIPTVNDDPGQIKDMCLWIKNNLGEDIPLQFIRYLPIYRLASLPPTPKATLESAEKLAREAGLKNVFFYYLGGVGADIEEKINCPRCGKLLLCRKNGELSTDNTEEGKCKLCGYRVLFIDLDKKTGGGVP